MTRRTPRWAQEGATSNPRVDWVAPGRRSWDNQSTRYMHTRVGGFTTSSYFARLATPPADREGAGTTPRHGEPGPRWGRWGTCNDRGTAMNIEKMAEK